MTVERDLRFGGTSDETLAVLEDLTAWPLMRRWFPIRPDFPQGLRVPLGHFHGLGMWRQPSLHLATREDLLLRTPGSEPTAEPKSEMATLRSVVGGPHLTSYCHV